MKKPRTLVQLKKGMICPNSVNKGKKVIKMPVSANNITRAIINYITLKGGFATRINTQGQYDPRLKIWRPGSTIKGMSDIVAVCDCKAYFIEVKVGNDKMSKDQLRVMDEVIQAGGYYLIAHTFDQFKPIFDSHLKYS